MLNMKDYYSLLTPPKLPNGYAFKKDSKTFYYVNTIKNNISYNNRYENLNFFSEISSGDNRTFKLFNLGLRIKKDTSELPENHKGNTDILSLLKYISVSPSENNIISDKDRSIYYLYNLNTVKQIDHISTTSSQYNAIRSIIDELAIDKANRPDTGIFLYDTEENYGFKTSISPVLEVTDDFKNINIFNTVNNISDNYNINGGVIFNQNFNNDFVYNVKNNITSSNLLTLFKDEEYTNKYTRHIVNYISLTNTAIETDENNNINININENKSKTDTEIGDDFLTSLTGIKVNRDKEPIELSFGENNMSEIEISKVDNKYFYLLKFSTLNEFNVETEYGFAFKNINDERYYSNYSEFGNNKRYKF